MEIGVDIIEINRIKKACQHKTFKTRFYKESLKELSVKETITYIWQEICC